MLMKFCVEGFKNFKEKIYLDFSDVRDYQFNIECIRNGLLNKLIVYGKNASGKSNLGLALFDIVSHLTNKNVTPGLYDNYLNVDSTLGYAEFSYTFRFDQDIVHYVYLKDESQKLLSEFLSVNNKTLLQYDYLNKTGFDQGMKDIAPTLNWVFMDDISIFKYVMNNSALPEKHPLRRMLRFISNMLWFQSLDEKNRYIGYTSKAADFYEFVFSPDVKAEFEQLLSQAGIDEKLTVLADATGKKTLYFDRKTPLPFFRTASSGTKALYTLFYWFKSAKEASLMFIDEFDAFYHYDLAETIVRLLESIPTFQTILTSHNTNLLTNRIMRPDCYFVLSSNGLTSFANATERELREGHNLEKLYMSGEFNG